MTHPGGRLPFSVRLLVPVMGVTVRHGWLVEGPNGWGELSPLPSWSPAEQDAAERCLTEWLDTAPATSAQPVAVNAMVPRIAPHAAAQLAVASGCTTVKVKVGDDDGEARVAAVRSALGPSARLRLDANGAWDLDRAVAELTRLARHDIELVEDPVAALEDLAALRRRTPVPVAAEMCIRTVDDAARLARLDAADAVVLKPQRIGGVTASLAAAEAARVPAIASSALETSVGLAVVLAVAAALGDGPFAHGVGTALLLADDVTSEPLLPVGGRLLPRAVVPDLLLAGRAEP
jgi:O-succinylbenzoate synthase